MHVTKDKAIKEIKESMRKDILDREVDLANLTRIIDNLISYLPCSVERSDEWQYAWDTLSERSQNEVIEAASIARDENEAIKIKYYFD